MYKNDGSLYAFLVTIAKRIEILMSLRFIFLTVRFLYLYAHAQLKSWNFKKLKIFSEQLLHFNFLHSCMVCTHFYAFQVQALLIVLFFFCIYTHAQSRILKFKGFRASATQTRHTVASTSINIIKKMYGYSIKMFWYSEVDSVCTRTMGACTHF